MDTPGTDNRPRSPFELQHMLSQHPAYHTCFTCMGWCAHVAPVCPHCGTDQAGWYQRWDAYVRQRQALVDDISNRVDARARAREAERGLSGSDPNVPGWRWDRNRGKYITEDQFQHEGNNFLIFLAVVVGGLFLMVAFVSCGLR